MIRQKGLARGLCGRHCAHYTSDRGTGVIDLEEVYGTSQRVVQTRRMLGVCIPSQGDLRPWGRRPHKLGTALWVPAFWGGSRRCGRRRTPR